MEASKKEDRRLEKLIREESKDQDTMQNKSASMSKNVVLGAAESTPKSSPITSEKYKVPKILEMYSGKKSIE